LPELVGSDFLLGLSLVLATNIVLSGDNAVVIAMAARRLHGSRRRRAIVWGAAGAVVLRLIFAGVVTYLLAVPFLQVPRPWLVCYWRCFCTSFGIWGLRSAT